MLWPLTCRFKCLQVWQSMCFRLMTVSLRNPFGVVSYGCCRDCLLSSYVACCFDPLVQTPGADSGEDWQPTDDAASCSGWSKSIVMLASYDDNSMAWSKGIHIHKETLQTTYTPITLHSAACYHGIFVALWITWVRLVAQCHCMLVMDVDHGFESSMI